MALKRLSCVLAMIIMTIIIALPAASATVTVDITISPSFTLGETLSFNYTITSTAAQRIVYTARVVCPKGPVPVSQKKRINLIPNQSFKGTYSDIAVDKSIEPQICTAYVEILSPKPLKEEKTFEILTNPKFKLDLLTCKDSGCLDKAKVFRLNENIYLNYQSEVENPSITATLVSPNKKVQSVNLPTSITATQAGTYILKVTATKTGYKTIENTVQFAVIKKSPRIRLAEFEPKEKERTMKESLSILREKSSRPLPQIKSEKGELILNTTKGKRTIKILPDEAIEKAKGEGVENVENIDIVGEEKPVYKVRGNKSARIIGLVPVIMEIEVEIDIETGETTAVRKPWWAFLV